MSHTQVHHHLTGADKINTSDYEDVKSIRKERLINFKGHEVISESADALLIGKKKNAVELPEETKGKGKGKGK